MKYHGGKFGSQAAAQEVCAQAAADPHQPKIGKDRCQTPGSKKQALEPLPPLLQEGYVLIFTRIWQIKAILMTPIMHVGRRELRFHLRPRDVSQLSRAESSGVGLGE